LLSLSVLLLIGRLVDILQQSSDVHVAVKLLALSAALLPLILVSGFIYNKASGVPLSQSLYKVIIRGAPVLIAVHGN
jgi:hypothetical protein